MMVNSKSKSKAHEIRRKSTSMALGKGVGIGTILRSTDWLGSSVLAKHYLREQRELEGGFGRAVLSL